MITLIKTYTLYYRLYIYSTIHYIYSLYSVHYVEDVTAMSQCSKTMFIPLCISFGFMDFGMNSMIVCYALLCFLRSAYFFMLWWLIFSWMGLCWGMLFLSCSSSVFYIFHFVGDKFEVDLKKIMRFLILFFCT